MTLELVIAIERIIQIGWVGLVTFTFVHIVNDMRRKKK